jgi:hypothetical protein
LWSFIWERAKDLGGALDKMQPTELNVDRQYKDASAWERSQDYLDYVEEHVDNWDRKELFKWAATTDKRHKREDEYQLLFPHWVATQCLIQGRLVEECTGKWFNKAMSRMEWFTGLYMKHNVEDQLEKKTFLAFDTKNLEISDEDESDGTMFSRALSHHRWADLVDLKLDAERVAAKHNISTEEALSSFFAEMDR